MTITDAMVNRFLTWPLPESVCADLCATKQGAPHRTGTNLLSFIEARQMLEHVLAETEPDSIPTQQAALEQVAREWLVKTGQVFWNGHDAVPSENDVADLVDLLAAQRAAGLEEVANEMARHPYWSKEAEIWIKHLRQLAQEQRP